MAFYTTVERVTDALPKMVQSLSNVTSSVIASHIEAADSIINGKLASMYTVPISGSNLLQTIATDLACYRLLRRQFTQERKNKSEWPDSFKNAGEDLDEVASGKMTLTNSAGEVISPRQDIAWSNTDGYLPTFAEDAFENATIDAQKLEDLSNDRADIDIL